MGGATRPFPVVTAVEATGAGGRHEGGAEVETEPELLGPGAELTGITESLLLSCNHTHTHTHTKKKKGGEFKDQSIG